MRCPKCGEEIPEGKLYCEKCGEEIQIVPDYDPLLEVTLNQDTEEKEPPKTVRKETKPVQRNPKIGLYVMRAVLVLLMIAVLGLSYVTQRNLKRTDSLEYQIKQAEKYQNLGEYDKAIECYSRASELDTSDVELLVKLANLYYLKNDQAWHEAMLRKILAHKGASLEQKRFASKALVTILIKKGDFDGINKLIKTSDDEELQETYKEYLSAKPEFSLEEGTYDEMQYLQIASTSEFEGKIYYTLDGSTPGENGTLYSLPIILESGSNVVRACFINEYGVKSDIITGTYVIEDGESVQ